MILSQVLSGYGITWPRGTYKRHRAHWAVVLLSCIGLSVLHTRLHRAVRTVFRSVSDIISDNFCVVCTHIAFFIKKQKALRDVQILFQLMFASFVPSLTD